MTAKMVFLPPQRDETREWARAVADNVAGVQVVVTETPEEAAREIEDADAAFGTLPPETLERARRLRWLQAPAAAPPAGYYYPELARHPVQVTNFRGIFNEHIAAHIMAFVLAFARGLHRYIPLQPRHEWQPAALDEGMMYLPESTALIVGAGGIGAETAKLCAAFGMRVVAVDARVADRPEGWAGLHRRVE